MTVRNQIIGLIRFSYPATEGFAVSGMDEDALLAMLYDPARLASRFAYLETITLPSLAAQTDGDFTCVILAGDSLPADHKQRLRALRDRFLFVRPIFMERMGPLPSAKRSFRRAVRDGTTHVTGFRLDDDDALAVDYIAKTRDRADRLIAGGFADNPLAIARPLLGPERPGRAVPRIPRDICPQPCLRDGHIARHGDLHLPLQPSAAGQFHPDLAGAGRRRDVHPHPA